MKPICHILLSILLTTTVKAASEIRVVKEEAMQFTQDGLILSDAYLCQIMLSAQEEQQATIHLPENDQAVWVRNGLSFRESPTLGFQLSEEKIKTLAACLPPGRTRLHLALIIDGKAISSFPIQFDDPFSGVAIDPVFHVEGKIEFPVSREKLDAL